MERDNLLRRISLVGKSIQRPPGCRFPYRRHDMGTGFPRGMYTFLPDWRDMLFKYKFDDDRNNKFRRFIASPFVNDEVNALAEEALNKSSIGMDDITDLLALTYYAGNYAHKSVQECAMEIQDTYVRLDRSIANLLDVLDKKVGYKTCFFSSPRPAIRTANRPIRDYTKSPAESFISTAAPPC